MAINQDIISTSWEGQQKSYIEAGLKTLLQRMLEVLESPLAANSVGSNQLTQELRDVINSIGSKVPNTRTVNSKELSSNITIGPDDIMVGNQTLADKLDDMDDAIGQGGDTSDLATRIAALEQSLNNLTGAEDTTQIIDTFNEVIDFLANVNNNETLLGKLQQLQTQINSKANDNAVVKSISVNGGTPQTPQNGNVNIQVQTGSTISPATASPSMDGTAAVGSSAKYAREDHVHPHDSTKLSKSDVSVETQGDGTVDINVKDDTYSINLNHAHEGMAKLVVDTAANLPDASEMESDTIYGELDDGEIATIYLGGYPFYGGGGGGGSTEPALREPAAGSVIDMGEYASGSLEATVKVKGRKLTEALTVEIDGTGFAFAQTQPSGVTVVSTTELTVTAEAANTLSGVDIAVVYTGTQYNAQGTFGVNSSEVFRECVIRASYIALPSGYTACEYIENGATINNNIYINTGVDVTSSLRIVGKYKVAPSKSWQALFGMYLNDNAHYRCMSGDGDHPIMFMLKGSDFGTAYRVADTNPHEFDLNKERLIFDGTEYPSETSSEWTTDRKLYLFSLNNASNNNASEGSMANTKVYYFKIYNGSSLVRDFRPAYEQSTQKYGMYDLVQGVFYPSSGSGNFSGQQITQ